MAGTDTPVHTVSQCAENHSLRWNICTMAWMACATAAFLLGLPRRFEWQGPRSHNAPGAAPPVCPWAVSGEVISPVFGAPVPRVAPPGQDAWPFRRGSIARQSPRETTSPGPTSAVRPGVWRCRVRRVAERMRCAGWASVKGNPVFSRNGNLKFPTLFRPRFPQDARGRRSTSPSSGTNCRGC